MTADKGSLSRPGDKKKFLVRSFYKDLSGFYNDHCFPWKAVWNCKVPSNIVFFIWTASLGRISPLIIWGKSTSNGLVLFVQENGNQWTIFCCIVKWPSIYRMRSLIGPGWHGLSLEELWIFFKCSTGIRGGFHIAVDWKMIRHCIMWFCGLRETRGAMKTQNILWMSWRDFLQYFTLFGFGHYF